MTSTGDIGTPPMVKYSTEKEPVMRRAMPNKKQNKKRLSFKDYINNKENNDEKI